MDLLLFRSLSSSTSVGGGGGVGAGILHFTIDWQ